MTSEQALADYADFLIKLKACHLSSHKIFFKTSNNGMKYTYDNSTAVIAFGGSYGGMLAAWMRMFEIINNSFEELNSGSIHI